MRNDCKNCPYAERIDGITHTRCSHPIVPEVVPIILKNYPRRPELKDTDDNVLLSIDPVGYSSGYASWPVDFDPTWITCKLPISEP